jgi:hypothetical protein
MEDRLDADLRLGRYRELVAELEGLVRDHPLRERLWAQLLLALYRSGRRPMRCWPTSGPGRSLLRSSASTRGRSCAGCMQRSSPRIQGWTCRRRPKPVRPGNSRRRWRRWARCLPAERPSWLGCGPPGHGPPMAGAGWSLWPAARAWARPDWLRRLPGRSTTRAHGCCTAAAPRWRPTRCSHSRTRSRASAHPHRICLRPGLTSPWPPVARRSPTYWPAGPTGRCCWS